MTTAGGVALDGSPPLGTVDVPVGGEAAKSLSTGAQVASGGKSLPAFGYLEIAYSADGTWSGTIHSPPEKLTLAECGSMQQAGGSVCQLGSGLLNGINLHHHLNDPRVVPVGRQDDGAVLHCARRDPDVVGRDLSSGILQTQSLFQHSKNAVHHPVRHSDAYHSAYRIGSAIVPR